MAEITDDDIRMVYEWVDSFEFSKQKKILRGISLMVY